MSKNIAGLSSLVFLVIVASAAQCSGGIPDIWVDGIYTPQNGCEVVVEGRKSTPYANEYNQFEMYANAGTRSEARKRYPRRVGQMDSVRFLREMEIGCGVRIPSGEKGMPATMTPVTIDFIKTPADSSVSGTLVLTRFVSVYGNSYPTDWRDATGPAVHIHMANEPFASGSLRAEASTGSVELTQHKGVVEKIHFHVLMRDPRRGK